MSIPRLFAVCGCLTMVHLLERVHLGGGPMNVKPVTEISLRVQLSSEIACNPWTKIRFMTQLSVSCLHVAKSSELLPQVKKEGKVCGSRACK